MTARRRVFPSVLAGAQPPTTAQMAHHAVQIAEALADTPPRVADALDMLDDAADLDARGAAASPLLSLFAATLLPGDGDYRPHTGDAAPVADDVLVAVDLGTGRPLVDRAGLICWGPGLGPAGEGRVLRWAPITWP